MHAQTALVRGEAIHLPIHEFITSVRDQLGRVEEESVTIPVPGDFSEEQIWQVVKSARRCWNVTWRNFSHRSRTKSFVRELDRSVILHFQRAGLKQAQPGELKDFQKRLEESFMDFDAGLISTEDWLLVELPSYFSNGNVVRIILFAQEKGYEVDPDNEVKPHKPFPGFTRSSITGAVTLGFRPMSLPVRLKKAPAKAAEAKLSFCNLLGFLEKLNWPGKDGESRSCVVYDLPANLHDGQIYDMVRTLRMQKFTIRVAARKDGSFRREKDGRVRLLFGQKAQGMVLVSAEQALADLDLRTGRQWNFNGFAPASNFLRVRAS